MDPNTTQSQNPAKDPLMGGTPPPPAGAPPLQTIPTVNKPDAGTPAAASPGGSKKTMMILVIIFLIVGILVVGGFFAYQMVSKKNPDLQPPSAIEGSANELVSEASNLEVDDVDGKLTEIDQQINSIEGTPSASASAKMDK